MRKYICLLCFIFVLVPSVFAIEIDQPKAVETIHHVLPEETPTIETSEQQKYDDLYFPAEVELKGSVIYDEGANVGSEIELDHNIEKPKIRLKTANMVIPVNEKKIYTTGLNVPARSALSTASRLSGEEYIIAPVWSSNRT